TVVGTAAYMSPEQARGRSVDSRTDVFSLGVVLYEMLTRRQPFTGETFNHVIVAILEKDPPALSTTGDQFPVNLERILKLALAKRPDERYPSAQAFLLDLKKLQRSLEQDTDLNTETANSPAGDPSYTLAPQPGVSTPSVRASQQRRWWIAFGALLVLAAAFFAGRSFVTGGKPIESIAVLPFVNSGGN